MVDWDGEGGRSTGLLIALPSLLKSPSLWCDASRCSVLFFFLFLGLLSLLSLHPLAFEL